LGHPIYAIAVVLAAFLIFAGIGSGLSQWFKSRLGADLRISGRRAVLIAVSGIISISLIYVNFLPHVFANFMWLGDVGRIGVSALLIAPLAFFMGMPFPIGLTLAGELDTSLIPWAWGINGCASVISPMIATLIAIHFGFTAVIALAASCYFLAALVLRGISQN
jgi:hypothetical protein